MNLIKLIISIQALLAFLCLLIQLYALLSTKWAIFESRVELGLIEEHGHYGLWSICTSKLVPAEVPEEGPVQDISDCEPMNTLFKPAHSRSFIALFSLTHAVALIIYSTLLAVKLLQIGVQESSKANDNDLETNLSPLKRALVIVTRFLIKSAHSEEDTVKRQIRIKLYTISVAAASTSLALLSAITPRRPLRDTDVFQLNNVSATNYRVWRGPAFWAQLTTLIMDMLITSLIAIEVRVLFVLQQQQLITTTCSTSDNEANVQSRESVIANPFFRHSQHNGTPNLERTHGSIEDSQSRHRAGQQHSEIQETSMTLQRTLPKVIAPSGSTVSTGSSEQSSPSQSNTSRYVNSKEVRQLKKLMHRNQPHNEPATKDSPLVAMASGATSYCNPMFSESDTDAQSTSNC